jgi:hypothetical protein
MQAAGAKSLAMVRRAHVGKGPTYSQLNLPHQHYKSQKYTMARPLHYTDAEWDSLYKEAEDALSLFSHKTITPPSTVAHYVDHTQLKLDATSDQIDELCLEARTYGFAVYYRC